LEEIQIRPLRSELLNEVIVIHQAGLGYSLNSRLGTRHLAYLYDSMQRDPDCHVSVALANGRPVGMVSGTLNAEDLKSRLMRSMPADRMAAMAVRLLFQPRLIVQWIRERGAEPPLQHEGQEVVAELTTIAVDARFQGLGLGRRLVYDIEQFFGRRHVASYRLETLVENATARAFYRGLGFVEIGRRGNSLVLWKAVSQ
jgi:ribosomal protein S18 acetylase RimI-like enzyme